MTTETLSQPELIQKYQSILNNNGLRHKRIKNVVVTDPDLLGEHFGSTCKYVTLELHGSNEKNLELFVKQVPTNAAHSELLKEFDVFAKEAKFFNVLLKDLQKFYIEKSGNSKPMDFFPTCFFADNKEIILDNLVKNHGYYLNPKTERQDLVHSTMAMENLAIFHAATYSLAQELGEEEIFKKYGFCLKEVLYTHENPMLSGMFDNSKNTAIALLNNNDVPGGDKALKALTSRGENVLEKLLNAVSRDNTSTIYNLINHGDCWTNNMMFLKDPVTGNLKHHVFVDFQITRYGSPNLDIGYYMFTSIKPEVRKQHWKNLLSLYFKKFTSTVELLTKNPISCTFEEFLTDFKAKSVVGFWTNVFFTTGMEAMAAIDPSKMETDFMTFFDTAITKWIKENPEKARKCTMDLVEFVDEYENILASD